MKKLFLLAWMFYFCWVLMVSALDSNIKVKQNLLQSIKLEDERKYEVEITFKVGGCNIPVYVKIIDDKGRDVLSQINGFRFVANRKAVFLLKNGLYRIIVSAGPRYTIHKEIIKVSGGGIKKEIKLEEFFAMSKDNWVICDPFVEDDSAYTPKFFLENIISRMDASGVDFCGVESFPIVKKKNFKSESLLKKQLNRIFLSKAFYNKRITSISTNRRIEDVGSTDIKYGIFELKNRKKQVNYWSKNDADKDFFYLVSSGPHFDAIDISVSKFNRSLWYTLLNLGFRLPAVSGGPKKTSSPNIYPEATMYLSKDNYENKDSLIDIIKKGNSCVGNGPFVSFKIDGKSSGDILKITKKMRNLSFNAFSSSAYNDSIRKIDIIYNGKVIRAFKGEKNQRSLNGKYSLSLDSPGWVIVKYRGNDSSFWAIANPIYVGYNIEPMGRKLTTRISIKAFSDKHPVPCLIEVWDKNAMLGRFTIPETGKLLTFPSTSIIEVFDMNGNRVNEFSIFNASGAGHYVDNIAKNNSTLIDGLLSVVEYQKIAKLLAVANVEVDIVRSKSNNNHP